jgi:uncharacterized protein (TIGR03437 family)
VLAAVSAQLATAYNTQIANGNPLHRTDPTNIQFLVNVASASANNANGVSWVTSGSNVLDATSKAMQSWNAVTTATLSFAPPQTTTLFDNPTSTNNVISFDPSEEAQELVNGAIAVTNRIYNPSTGVIIKSDILFDAQKQYSTSLAPGAFDLQSALTHELGHTLGANHSGVVSATMFQAFGTQDTDEATLKPDDISFVTSLYPATNQMGTLSGVITSTSGTYVRGALISAQSPTTGTIVGSMSSTADGSFSMLLPAGSYYVWAEPLNGQVGPANVALTAADVDTGWQPVFYGGFGTLQAVHVGAGQNTSLNLTGGAGASSIEVAYSGAVPVGSTATTVMIYTGPMDVPTGEQVFIFIQAAGLGSDLTEANLQLVGPVSLIPNSLTSLGNNQFQMAVQAPAVSAFTAASLLINYHGQTASFSGGILLHPVAPAFPAAGVTNAFSYAREDIAPGEIISIFGTNLSNTTVTVNGQAAPIFYAGAEQLNVEVPYQVAAGSNATIVVTNSGGVVSAPVTVSVASSAPGLFTSAVDFTTGGNLNSVSAPARPGDWLILYAVGLGTLSNPIATGATASGPDATAAPVTVNLGGQTLSPGYAGASPGFIGLDQINVQLPTSVAAGTTNLTVSVNGQPSQSIPIFLQ